MGTDEGVELTLERLRDHNGKDTQKRKRGRTLPLFDCVPINNYVVSILQLEIRETNNVYNHMVSEAQSTCEGYTSRYFELENAMVIGKVQIYKGKKNCGV